MRGLFRMPPVQTCLLNGIFVPITPKTIKLVLGLRPVGPIDWREFDDIFRALADIYEGGSMSVATRPFLVRVGNTR